MGSAEYYGDEIGLWVIISYNKNVCPFIYDDNDHVKNTTI